LTLCTLPLLYLLLKIWLMYYYRIASGFESFDMADHYGDAG
jgi:hypothetical protein